MVMSINEKKRDIATKTFTPVNGYLFTPPENIVDSFSKEDDSAAQPVTEWQTKLPPLQAHTPPASPLDKSLPSLASATGFATHDTPLFPERDRVRSQTPLFGTDRSQSPQRAQSAPSDGDAAIARDGAVGRLSDLKNHLPAIDTTATTTIVSKPSPSDIFPAILGVRTPRDALSYWHSRLNELEDLRRATSKLPSPKTSFSSERDWLSRSQLRRVSKPTGVTKSRSPPKPVSKPKAPAAASEKSTPQRKRTPKARSYSDFVDSAFPSGQQQVKHKRAPPSKKVESANVSWSELPDYTPPTSTLDSNPKALKANWHGNAIDLSSDVDRAHLHPQELAVAATLRLSGAQYLFNKRKIFQARLQSIKDGKNFTKTAAQGACSIDVNKASQLWEAFERVGWLKEGWFEQYL